ncbi:MAG: FecR domain-containing protein [Bacteroidales bacterium]|nr:FecR domain-containing protein [Bacteroidales bacterium]
MNEEQKNIDRLIEAYLRGELKEDEYSRLLGFLKTEPLNKDHFTTYIRHWSPEKNADSDSSWQKLNSKISRMATLESNFKARKLVRPALFRIAAILVIGLFIGASIGSLVFLGKLSDKSNLVFEAPRGEKSLITLSDSSTIWLNGGSRVEVDRNYGITNRKIKMEGEAYFNVSKNKRLAFKVDAGEINIKVIGTKFNISAYKTDSFIETTVEEGTVQVSSAKDNMFRPVKLKANQMAVYDKFSNELNTLYADVETIVAWKNQMLIMDNEHYERVFKKLGNWYGVNFNFMNRLNYPPRYTMTIKTESLNEVMELLHFITPMEYKIEKDQVYVKFKAPN